MNNLTNLVCCDPRLAADLMHPVNDRIFRGGISCQNLGRISGPINLKNDIGERPSDIDAQTGCDARHSVNPLVLVEVILDTPDNSNKLLYWIKTIEIIDLEPLAGTPERFARPVPQPARHRTARSRHRTGRGTRAGPGPKDSEEGPRHLI